MEKENRPSERYETSRQIAENAEYNQTLEDMLEAEIDQAIEEDRLEPWEKDLILDDFRRVYPNDIYIRKKHG